MSEGDKRLQFIEPSYQVLLNKHPAVFDKSVCDSILKVFRTEAKNKNLFLSKEELLDLLSEENPNLKRDNDRPGQEDRAFKENFSVLLKNEIIKEIPYLEFITNDLNEETKYFFQQKETDLSKEADEHSKKAICDVVMQRMDDLYFPFTKILTADNLFWKLKDHLYHANYLLHQLITDKTVIKVPFLEQKHNSEDYIEILLPGLPYKEKINQWINDRFIPDLKREFSKIRENISLKKVFEKYMFFIIENEIEMGGYKKPVYQLCFMIIETKRSYEDSISIETFNLANLILNIWLFLEHDPLIALQEYPNIEIGVEFLSPFFTQYIQEFSHIKDYLKMIKGFIDHHSAVIEKNDLADFFRSKGVQRKIVEEFIESLPSDIQDIETKKKFYIISKGQIISAIENYHKDKSYRKIESAKIEFEIVSQGFYLVEQSCFENEEQILKTMKTNLIKFKKAKGLIAKNSETYREHQKRKNHITLPRIPHKKVYVDEDFKNFNKNIKEHLIKHHNLFLVDSRDKKGKWHNLYVRKNDLNLKEAKLFIGVPDYDTVLRYFKE